MKLPIDCVKTTVFYCCFITKSYILGLIVSSSSYSRVYLQLPVQAFLY